MSSFAHILCWSRRVDVDADGHVDHLMQGDLQGFLLVTCPTPTTASLCREGECNKKKRV